MATTSEHVAEYTRNHGALNPETAWILSPFDTWEANPSFVGPRPPHPESCEEELDAWYDAQGRREEVELAAEVVAEAAEEEARTAPLTREQQLRAGRAYNAMNDHECGTDSAAADPTGDMGWIMMTIQADRQAHWDTRGYDVILLVLAEDVLQWEGAN